MTATERAVVGCDAARGAWVAVELSDGVFARLATAPGLEALVAEFPRAQLIAVDMPIGLPTDGPREADIQAKEFVGPRRNSVFPTPVRAALEADTHADAVIANREATGNGISQQSYALRRTILEVEAIATDDPRIYEAHPEASFREMAGDYLVSPKASWNGFHHRLGLLREQGIELPEVLDGVDRARADDVLDAAAVAWTANRIAGKAAIRLGDPSEANRRDLAIWV